MKEKKGQGSGHLTCWKTFSSEASSSSLSSSSFCSSVALYVVLLTATSCTQTDTDVKQDTKQMDDLIRQMGRSKRRRRVLYLSLRVDQHHMNILS